MSATYRAVNWNRFKIRYDIGFGALAALYIVMFVTIGAIVQPELTVETLLIRAFGTGAFALLTITLSIGPLCRIDDRFLPLLYNRRHLGVLTFMFALAHASLSFVQFHFGGDLNPFVSLLVSNTRFGSLSQFPFELFGVAALLILGIMAVTSHDFWLSNLGPRTWKSLHMLVYLVFGLLVMHVALGAMQNGEGSTLLAALLVCVLWIGSLHILAGIKAMRKDRQTSMSGDDALLDVGSVSEFRPGCARLAQTPDGGIAVYRYGDKGEMLAAILNVCAHQGGPLSEGRVVDGCVTCPWHGYQYRPDDGCSPPPYTEVLKTYQVSIRDGRVLVDPSPRTPEAPATPVRIDAASEGMS